MTRNNSFWQEYFCDSNPVSDPSRCAGPGSRSNNSIPRCKFKSGNSSVLSSENSKDFPILETEVLRIYSMRFCPFAHRLRLVAASKKLCHELININLAQKPDWYLNITTDGGFPAAQFGAEVVAGSLFAAKYIDHRFPGSSFVQSLGPYERATDDIKLHFFDSHFVPAFKNLFLSGGKGSAVMEMEAHLQTIQSWLGTNSGRVEPGFLDLMIWPWLGRFSILQKLTGYQLPSASFQPVIEWIATMKGERAIAAMAIDQDHEIQYYVSFAKQKPNYDVGLDID